jgi:hypothetical protein
MKGGERNMKSAQKMLSFLFSAVLMLLMVSSVDAAQVQNMVVDLSNTDETASSTHAITWDNISSATLYTVRFQYCTNPSGTCTTPTNMNSASATKGTLTNMVTGDWSLVTSVNTKPRFENTNAGEDLGTDTVTVELVGVDNHDVGDCNAVGNASSDTCYVRLETYTDLPFTAPNMIDQGVASVTTTQAVTVDARVDPLFVFTIAADIAGTAHSEITTSVASTYDRLNFGNLTAGTPRYIAHMLRVTTNTENGYTITMRMNDDMTGTYLANNFDPFKSSWAVPTTWTEPTGQIPSQDTAWIGFNTNDFTASDNADKVEQFGNQLFGPVNSTDNVVMEEGGSDNGATPIYVTYGLEANVFQPADTYQGEIIYTALPVY